MIMLQLPDVFTRRWNNHRIQHAINCDKAPKSDKGPFKKMSSARNRQFIPPGPYVYFQHLAVTLLATCTFPPNPRCLENQYPSQLRDAQLCLEPTWWSSCQTQRFCQGRQGWVHQDNGQYTGHRILGISAYNWVLLPGNFIQHWSFPFPGKLWTCHVCITNRRYSKFPIALYFEL